MKVCIDAFLQSCRFGKYLSFANLLTFVIVLGLYNFHFRESLFLMILIWISSENAQKPKLVFYGVE